jgi:sulfatase modifying factor 1
MMRSGLAGVVVGVTVCVACGSVRSNNEATDGGVDSIDSDAPPPGQVVSCSNLLATCGASGTDSCCNSPEVLGGSYYRSYDLAGDGMFGSTGFPATVSSFRLDKYEVTVGRFRSFVNAGMGTQSSPPTSGAGAHANIADSGWNASWSSKLTASTSALVAAIKCDAVYQTWTDTPAGNEHRPMNCITWYEAMAFCAWDGGFLPTEAEWNYAATGGDQQRAYPWSNSAGSLPPLESSLASYFDGTNCVGDGLAGCAVTDLVAVGTKDSGVGRWGQSDLAGNVFEWTLDTFASYSSTCMNCANLAGTSFRVNRGGSFISNASSARTGYRGNSGSSDRNYNTGVRCARTSR